jgi:hypothetical protein
VLVVAQARREEEMTAMESQAEGEARLEVLIGHLADLLAPAREFVGELQIRSNAASTTRGVLRHLTDLTGSLWRRLGDIREEARQLRQQQ